MITPDGILISDAIGEKIFEDHKVAAAQMIRFDDYFKSIFGLTAFRPDVRLVVYVTSRGSVSVKEAMLDSVLSYRAFYTTLDRLKGNGWIEVQGDTHDGRVRRLNPGARIMSGMAVIPAWLDGGLLSLIRPQVL